MRTRPLFILSVSFVLVSASLHAQQSPAAGLQTALAAKYKLTKTGFGSGSRVTEPGAIYVVRVDGLLSREAYGQGTPTATIKDGQPLPVGKGFRGAIAASGNVRQVQPGERFYLVGIDSKEDSIVFHLLSLETYPVIEFSRTEQARFRMAVKFPIDTGSAANLTPEQIQALTDPIFSADGSSTAPASVKIGESRSDLERDLGLPDTILDLGERKILVYKTIKVTVVNGKVTDAA